MASWHLTDRNDHLVCELRPSIAGRAAGTSAEAAPSIIEAIVQEGGLIERDTPFRHYAPGPRTSRREKKRKS